MKKLILLVIPLLFILALFQNSHARTYYRTYEVAEITENGIVLKDFEGNRFLVDKEAGDLKVGDLVRYNSVKNRLKKSSWQPATITKITDRAITIETHDKENVEVNMRSKYRQEFKEGDQVYYNAKGQLKKSNLQPLDEE